MIKSVWSSFDCWCHCCSIAFVYIWQRFWLWMRVFQWSFLTLTTTWLSFPVWLGLSGQRWGPRPRLRFPILLWPSRGRRWWPWVRQRSTLVPAGWVVFVRSTSLKRWWAAGPRPFLSAVVAFKLFVTSFATFETASISSDRTAMIQNFLFTLGSPVQKHQLRLDVEQAFKYETYQWPLLLQL